MPRPYKLCYSGHYPDATYRRNEGWEPRETILYAYSADDALVQLRTRESSVEYFRILSIEPATAAAMSKAMDEVIGKLRGFLRGRKA